MLSKHGPDCVAEVIHPNLISFALKSVLTFQNREINYSICLALGKDENEGNGGCNDAEAAFDSRSDVPDTAASAEPEAHHRNNQEQRGDPVLDDVQVEHRESFHLATCLQSNIILRWHLDLE